MNEPTPADTPAPEVSQFAKSAARNIHNALDIDVCLLTQDEHCDQTAAIIQRAINESAKATPTLSLTGEEISDEIRTNCCDALFCDPGYPDSDICSECKEHAEHATTEQANDTPETEAALYDRTAPENAGRPIFVCPADIARSLERRLSTTRAQDKAALAEKDAEIERVKKVAETFQDQRDEIVRGIIANSGLSEREGSALSMVHSITDLAVQRVKDCDAIRADNERLKTRIEDLVQSWNHEHQALCGATSEVARLKAEVEAEQKTAVENFENWQLAVKATSELRTRLAQAQGECEKWKERAERERPTLLSELERQIDAAATARDLAEQGVRNWEAWAKYATQRYREDTGKELQAQSA